METFIIESSFYTTIPMIVVRVWLFSSPATNNDRFPYTLADLEKNQLTGYWKGQVTFGCHKRH